MKSSPSQSSGNSQKSKKSKVHKKEITLFRIIRKFWIQFLGLFLLSLLMVLSINEKDIVKPVDEILGSQNIKQSIVPVVLPKIPIDTKKAIFPEDITAGGLYIRDIESGIVLASRSADIKFAPASTTKIMTALVAMDYYSMDDVLTVKTVVDNGQSIGLFSGETMTFENLLLSALVHSANDAAYALAESYPGGLENFVKEMNVKAQEIHMTNSNFANPVGYDDPGHYMTPRDLGTLSIYALENKVFAKMVSIPLITVSDTTYSHFHTLKNVNQLLGKIPGVSGIKTGWTENSGENLVTLIKRDGKNVIFVILKSADRFGETVRLIDWVFENFEWRKVENILN